MQLPPLQGGDRQAGQSCRCTSAMSGFLYCSGVWYAVRVVGRVNHKTPPQLPALESPTGFADLNAKKAQSTGNFVISSGVLDQQDCAVRMPLVAGLKSINSSPTLGGQKQAEKDVEQIVASASGHRHLRRTNDQDEARLPTAMIDINAIIGRARSILRKVSAALTSAVSSALSEFRALVSIATATRSRSEISRRVIYFGQLPWCCTPVIVIDPSSRAVIWPYIRSRHRLDRSSPTTPTACAHPAP